jgi:hypothetical protein
MTAIEWDLSDLEDIPFEGGRLVPVVKAAKLCRCCDNTVYSPRAVYCSPKSTCRSRYHRNPARYQQQNATPVSSVAALTPETIRQIIREEIAGLNGGSSRPALSPERQLSVDLHIMEDLLESIEIRKDESAAARCSNNLRNTLMAMYNGEGAWANLGAATQS